MAIITNKSNKRYFKNKKKSDWWFALTKLRLMRKCIKKLYYITLDTQPNKEHLQELQVYPEDFKKLSNEQIERGLNLFVKRQELASWRPNKLNNADGYLLVFPFENRSQERFSKTKTSKLERIPQEINIDDIKLEPINSQQARTNVYTAPGEQQAQQEPIPTKKTSKIEVDSEPEDMEREPYEDDAEEFETNYADDDYSSPF